MRAQTVLDAAVTEGTTAAPAGASLTSTLEATRRELGRGLAQLMRQPSDLEQAAALLNQCLAAGNRLVAAGNGGSAAEAQHLVAELVGRFKHPRRALPALALTADSTVLTAIANDFGYSQAFARQVEAHVQSGDVVVLFSTSGESENILAAAESARRHGAHVIAITGPRASRLASACDVAVCAGPGDTARIQELHMVITHVLCESVERCLEPEDPSDAPTAASTSPLNGRS